MGSKKPEETRDPPPIWILNTSIRPGVFGVYLFDIANSRKLVSIRRSSNTFARSHEFDFEIYTEECVLLRGLMAQWKQIHAILIRNFPEYDLSSIEPPEGSPVHRLVTSAEWRV